MNINAAIVDQRLSQLVEDIREEAATRINIIDAGRLKSLAFVFLCVKTLLDLESAEALDTLIDGGQDFGVDALHIADEQDGEFTVTLFQGKYAITWRATRTSAKTALRPCSRRFATCLIPTHP